MTLCISWIRKVDDTEELVIATDSRLRNGQAWDCNPKILTLPRTDCAICFEGSTMEAYPMMLQLQSAVENRLRSKNRSQDLCDFKGFAIDVLNSMRTHISDLPIGQKDPDVPEVSFLLGGYSWKKSKFLLWTFFYDNNAKKFAARPTSYWKGIKGEKKIAFAGDYVGKAKKLLIDLLKSRNKLEDGNLDMEPFEVLRELLKNQKEYSLIGGPPQLLKVYRHMNVLPFAVKWNVHGKEVTSLLGRPLMSFEKSSHPIIDPETMKIEKPEI